jgi:phage-related protein
MTLTVNASFTEEKNKLEGAVPVRLIALEYADSAASWVYWALWNENVDYFQPNTATVQTYTAAPAEVGRLEAGPIDQSPSMSLKVSNVDRTMISYLELNDGLRGRKCHIIRTFDNLLGNASANIVETYYVDGAAAKTNQAELKLVGRTTFYKISVPQRAYRRDQCQWSFKSLQCLGSATVASPSVNATLASPTIQTCLKTLASCDIYNNTYRYGGYPGIPKARVVWS